VAVVVLGDGDRLQLTGLLVLPLVAVAGKLMGLYDRDELVLSKTTLDEAPALFHLATLYALVIWLSSGVFVVGELGARQVLGLWGCLLGGTLLCRGLARVLARRLAEPERCLVLGAPDSGDAICRKLETGRALNVTVVGRLPLDLDVQRPGELARVVRERDVHRVILAPGSGDNDAMLDTVRLVKALGLRVSVLPRVLEVVGSSVEFDEIEGITVLSVRSFGLSRSSRATKRGTDLILASIGLVSVAPFMLAIAIAIRLDSRGPILFRQVRVGRDGRRFELLKFRSMGVDAEDRKADLADRNETVGLFKIADDPRITRVGRFLRRTSLDEMPQLLNVLRGEMSLVGPRPLIVDEDEKIVGWHRRRLHLTPGMTGHWQILSSARLPMHEMVNIDYLYVANWSFWTDVKILLRTVPYVVRAQSM
jgi:exopolysaccharide biosynthesis polyprenyl glycosylphosphotransferase